jgi:imidazole glycerol-phosphate synthase subunit HisH
MDMLAVIDYGAGNLRSVLHALNHLGVENIRLIREPHELKQPDKIILPGVGAFGAGMQQLHQQNLVEPLKEALRAGIPYLGICLGMQFLFEYSDEMGNHEGLGILPGHVTRFPPTPGLKVPHMGWNQLNQKQSSPLLTDIPAQSSVYFVHSYYCAPANPADLVASVNYGLPFAAVVQRDNIFGVQFHPEKSQRTGLRLLTNFLELTA